MAKVYLGVGSNQGNRAENVQQAIEALAHRPDISVRAFSTLYESEPVGMEDPHAEWFVNAVVQAETELPPSQLLQACLQIEQAQGRTRLPESQAGYVSRTLDIDILFYDQEVIQQEGLQIPHPRLHERAFVLVPMLEIAPDWVHPVLGKTMHQMHWDLATPEEVVLLGTRS